MKNSIASAHSLLVMVLLAGMTIGATSCVMTSHPHPAKTKTVVVQKKKAHPHGGPPGQTKKPHGHPGKKH
jgi:hypothetical protein